MDFSIPQQKAIDIRDTNVVVSASAGSGKTAVLVERLCQLVLKDHISIDSILAMTFTKDAAAEMKARLLSKLKEQPKTEYILQQMALLEVPVIDDQVGRAYARPGVERADDAKQRHQARHHQGEQLAPFRVEVAHAGDKGDDQE